MRLLKEYHHFKEELIDPNDRVAKCERYVVDLLLRSNLPDSERESSVCWELKHQATTLQFARILALKRGLPVDICAVGLLLHDVYSIVDGKYQEHAHLGTPIAMRILKEIGGFSAEELDQISRIIYNHSDKHVWTDDPFQEIGKDVDVLDCFLYEGAFDFYLGNKPLPIFKHYLKRAKKVWKELELPVDPRFDLLDNYGTQWFQHIQTVSLKLMRNVLAILLELSTFKKEFGVCPPPFCILVQSEKGKFYASQRKWADYIQEIDGRLKDLVSEKNCRAVVSILNGFLKKKLDSDIIGQSRSLVKLGVISKENSEKAINILFGNQTEQDLKRHALLFWPLIDMYESLYGKKIIKRFRELGIEV